MEENYNVDNDLYVSIADFSKDEGFIKIPSYESKFIKNLDDFEVIPLTAYYFDAIRLFLNPESFISLEAFDNFVNLINLLWYACNKDNVKIINSFLEQHTNEIRTLIRKKTDNNYRVGYINLEYFQFKEPEEEIVRIYKNWLNDNGNKKIIDDFIKNRGNCVAIAIPLFKKLRNQSNCYLAISGTFPDYYQSNSKKSVKLYKMYENINNFIESIFGFRFIECHLNDYTKRYTYYSSYSDLYSDDFDGRALKTPINFRKDLDKWKRVKHI